MSPNTEETPPNATPPASGNERRPGNFPIFGLLALGAVAVIFTVGWGLALVSYNGAAYNVSHQMVAWRVVSDTEVSASFRVNSDEPAECILTAKDGHHVEVGQDNVRVDAGLHEVSHAFETTRRAAAVEITSCRAQPPESE